MKRQNKTSKSEKKIVLDRKLARELEPTELEQTVGGTLGDIALPDIPDAPSIC